MITVLVLVSLVALFGLCLPNLFRPTAPAGPAPVPDRSPRETPRQTTCEKNGESACEDLREDVHDDVHEELGARPCARPCAHPESMTAELDPGDEEYLACLANDLWPDDEYLEMEHTTDGEEEPGGSGMLL
ncbi:hypothetical protein [Actinomadura roseirufa]|uniref:hypothetical protein n=1 Tax=Actinomadura roseirufa TaxID=2094049 RepID=UPI0010419ACF|nr:hypothetical protein [Actinomadura roseirufa]